MFQKLNEKIVPDTVSLSENKISEETGKRQVESQETVMPEHRPTGDRTRSI